jgi:hypothetical protein
MASKETWEKIRYFKPNDGVDNFGDPDAIDDLVLLRLDDFRHFLSTPIYVTSGIRPEGSGRPSFHTRGKGGCAVDVVAPGYGGHPIDLIFSAMRFGFTGIGWYPDWSFHGYKCGGLHLDTRPLGMDADGTQNYSHSLWMAYGNPQKYIALNYENILKHIGGEYGRYP